MKFKSDPLNSKILDDKNMKSYNELVDVLIENSFKKVKNLKNSRF